MTENLLNAVKAALDDEPQVKLISNALTLYEWELYDEGWRLTEDELKEISLADDPEGEFCDMVYMFADQCSEMPRMEFVERIKKEIPMTEAELEEVNAWLVEHVNFIYPTDTLLEQEVRTNVIFADADEVNNDFSSYENGEINPYSGNCINWLIYHSRKKMKWIKSLSKLKRLRKAGVEDQFPVCGDPFVDSVIEEIASFQHVMGAFTVLLKLSLKEFIHLCMLSHGGTFGTVKLLPGVTCGIFNPWIGCGSQMGIELKKPCSIPAANIWSVWADGTKIHGYDPGEVYGFNNSVWTNNVVIF